LFSKNNPGYWRDRYGYVKEWRQKHPDYQRRWRQAKRKGRSSGEIQAEIRTKTYVLQRVSMKLFWDKIQAP
jgi:hypothetical protein